MAYAYNSLNWLIEDKIASDVKINGELIRDGIKLKIVIYSNRGILEEYINLWEATNDQL